MERYSRNILIEQIGENGQNKLLNSKILVAGAGGLGSSVIACLASAGVGNIGIIDNDVIELSNLNRQFIHKPENIGLAKVDSAEQWISEYNPDISVKTYKLRLDEENSSEIISRYDIVLDCFDSYTSKFALNKACVVKNKPLIHGGVTGFSGQVMTIIPGITACLCCLFSEDNSNQYIPQGVISPAVSVIASIQAMEALKLVLNIGELLTNRLLSYDGLSQKFRKFDLKRLNDCRTCKPAN